MIGNRAHRDFKKRARVTKDIVKGVVNVVSFVLPGGKVYKGIQAARKYSQYQKVKKMQAARGKRRAKLAQQGTHTLDGRTMERFLKDK